MFGRKKKEKEPVKQKRTLKSILMTLVTYAKGSDPFINISVLVLIAFGNIMIASTNVGLVSDSASSIILVILKQVVYTVIAYVASCVVNHFLKYGAFLIGAEYIIAIILIGLLAVTFMFNAVNGSQAWITFSGFSIQPTEFVKPFAILSVSISLYKAKRSAAKQRKWYRLFAFPFLVFLVCNVILVLQKDFGTLAIIDFIFFICVLIPDYTTIAKFQSLLIKLFCIACVSFVALVVSCNYMYKVWDTVGLSHIATRLRNTINPYADIYDDGYQPANALYAIADAGLFGKGLGNSERKYGYLSESDTDYILAVSIEETGLIGLTIIVAGYAVIIWRLFYYAFKTSENCFRVILIGTASYLFIHFLLNVGGVACLIPLTGVPLLFISRGGSALISIFVAIGMSQKVISQIKNKEKAIIW